MFYCSITHILHQFYVCILTSEPICILNSIYLHLFQPYKGKVTVKLIGDDDKVLACRSVEGQIKDEGSHFSVTNQ